jgi:bifunctional UDP-N-acetylglucosamine pyrophosphorylase/glucosamine-1-phosphate N-acetyltransferase
MTPTAIILAAGKSTRMKSRRPKVLHEVCGRPMLEYVLRACYDVGCKKVIVVVGHGKEQVMNRFADDSRITWVEQTEQLGTGHAAKSCEKQLKDHKGDVFILAGDGPLIRGDVLRTLLQVHHDDKAAASMATAILDDPTGYGRVIRDESGEFVEIIEQIDATPEQAAIREVFPSYYCVKSEELTFALARIKNENKKGEYYLTDLFGILAKAGKKVTAVQAVSAEDIMGVNTREHLADVDAIMQARIQRDVRDAGVTILNPQTTYIESGVTVGQDTVILPFSYIGRDASIGRDCLIGPYGNVPRNAIMPDGSTIVGDVSPTR